jgi:NAD(P)-dependent dehydrogenase (short-subunit alcohol dehydrogenase family)
MKELRGKVAVVTGAASGIGRAMAERFASEGMNVVLADVEEAALARTETELKAGARRCGPFGPTCPGAATSKRWPNERSTHLVLSTSSATTRACRPSCARPGS